MVTHIHLISAPVGFEGHHDCSLLRTDSNNDRPGRGTGHTPLEQSHRNDNGLKEHAGLHSGAFVLDWPDR